MICYHWVTRGNGTRFSLASIRIIFYVWLFVIIAAAIFSIEHPRNNNMWEIIIIYEITRKSPFIYEKNIGFILFYVWRKAKGSETLMYQTSSLINLMCSMETNWRTCGLQIQELLSTTQIGATSTASPTASVGGHGFLRQWDPSDEYQQEMNLTSDSLSTMELILQLAQQQVWQCPTIFRQQNPSESSVV